MMTFIGYFALFIFAVMAGYFCTKTAAFNVGKYFKQDMQILDMAIGIGSAIPVLLTSFVMTLFNPSACAFLFIYLTSLLACLMIIGFFRKPVKVQVWGLILLCFTGTFFFPGSVLVAGWSGLMMQVVLTVFWMAFLYAFVQIDRAPFLTSILSVGYMLTVCLMVNYNLFEGPMAAIALMLSAFSMGVALMLGRLILSPRLGVHASVLMGFLWGFFATYILALGRIQTALYMGGYLFLEFGCILACTVLVAKRFFPLTEPFLIERAIMTKVEPRKALSFVMWMNVILCLLGTIFVSKSSWVAANSGWVLLGLILAYIAYRLLNWSKKQARLRDLFADAKQGVSTLIQEAKQTGKTIGQKEKAASQKQPTTVKKEPVAVRKTTGKKTVKKAVVKKVVSKPVVKKNTTKPVAKKAVKPVSKPASKTITKKTVVKAAIKKNVQKKTGIKKTGRKGAKGK